MKLAVIDLETTGLHPARNYVLEVAVATLGDDLKPEEGLSMVVHYDEDVRDEMRQWCDPHVAQMHTDNGLWDALPKGDGLAYVDAKIAQMLDRYAEGEKVILVGNSCRLDLNFIEAHLPHTYKRLHYRSIDLSAVLLFSQATGYELEYEKPQSNHRAMDDVHAAIDQLQAYVGTWQDLSVAAGDNRG